MRSLRKAMDVEQGEEQVGEMASGNRKDSKRRVRYFYVKVDDVLHLHRVLHINRPQDLVMAWDYVDHKRRMYNWTDVRRTMQSAFTITDVAEILGIHRMTVDGYIREGKIKTPQRIYNLSTRVPGKYFFSEDDVLDLHAALSEVHQGRPRKDGLVTNNRMPDRSTVRTLVRRSEVLYTKDKDGQFVPIWKEQVW
jgi:hypothetical protein